MEKIKLVPPLALILIISAVAMGVFLRSDAPRETPPIEPHRGWVMPSLLDVERIARDVAEVLGYSPEETERYVASVLRYSRIPPDELILMLKIQGAA